MAVGQSMYNVSENQLKIGATSRPLTISTDRSEIGHIWTMFYDDISASEAFGQTANAILKLRIHCGHNCHMVPDASEGRHYMSSADFTVRVIYSHRELIELPSRVVVVAETIARQTRLTAIDERKYPLLTGLSIELREIKFKAMLHHT